MRFTDLQYVLFLTGAFVAFRLLRRWRGVSLGCLTLASLAFYGSWDPRFLWLLAASTLLDFGVGAALGRTEREGARRALLACSIVGNLGMLGVFKYGDFLAEGADHLLAAAGAPLRLGRLGVALPIGISFYSFQTLSYSVDVYRRQLKPARNLLEFTLFVCFFPQLVAGPIVRASEFLPQLDRPERPDAGAIGEGVVLIAIGMVKKMVVGDMLGRALVDPFFAEPGRFNAAEALLCDWAAYFSLYCDFSGYTDIALGSALLFGFRLPGNFDRPAFAPSPLEHWRRWHMTLGTFLRDYLYRPLGGSRVSAAAQWRNIFLVFLVSGVWHGVGASYVLMGIYNGLLAATWRWLRPRSGTSAVERLLAFQLTALSVLCLRPIPFDQLEAALASFTRWRAPPGGLFDAWATTVLAAVVALHLTPRRWKEAVMAWGREADPLALALVIVVTGGVCSLHAIEVRDFYYFQF